MFLLCIVNTSFSLLFLKSKEIRPKRASNLKPNARERVNPKVDTLSCEAMLKQRLNLNWSSQIHHSIIVLIFITAWVLERLRPINYYMATRRVCWRVNRCESAAIHALTFDMHYEGHFLVNCAHLKIHCLILGNIDVDLFLGLQLVLV
jgi:hypothetical protein